MWVVCPKWGDFYIYLEKRYFSEPIQIKMRYLPKKENYEKYQAYI